MYLALRVYFQYELVFVLNITLSWRVPSYCCSTVVNCSDNKTKDIAGFVRTNADNTRIESVTAYITLDNIQSDRIKRSYR